MTALALPVQGPTFLSAPRAEIGEINARFAVLGIPYGVPYTVRNVAPSVADAPRAIRERSARFGRMLGHHDFDLEGPLATAGDLALVDCGDVPADPRDFPASAARATEAVRGILAAGAMPIVLGGDDSVAEPFLAAWRERGPVTVVHVPGVASQV